MSTTTTCWHVTERVHALKILAKGFLGGWGDAGFGVYVFTDFSDATDYANAGGWDGELQDPVFLQLEVKNEDLSFVEVDPAWPNPEDYENVQWVPMNQDKSEERWSPLSVCLSMDDPSYEAALSNLGDDVHDIIKEMERRKADGHRVQALKDALEAIYMEYQDLQPSGEEPSA